MFPCLPADGIIFVRTFFTGYVHLFSEKKKSVVNKGDYRMMEKNHKIQAANCLLNTSFVYSCKIYDFTSVKENFTTCLFLMRNDLFVSIVINRKRKRNQEIVTKCNESV